MSLPREILKWIQGLDLSYSVKNPKRDFSNGFLLAEILSRYWREVPLHSFDNGSSLLKKADNWQLLDKLLKKRGYQLSRETIDGVMHQKNGYVVPLLENVYAFLTKRQIQTIPALEHEEVPKPSFTPVTVVRALEARDLDTQKSSSYPAQFSSTGTEMQSTMTAPAHVLGPVTAELDGGQNVTFTEVKVKAVDSLSLLRGLRSDAFTHVSSHVSEAILPLKGIDSNAVSTEQGSSVLQLMTNICRVALRSASPSLEANYGQIHQFVAHLASLNGDTKALVWGSLSDKATTIATHLKSHSTEYFSFLTCLATVFETHTPVDDDWVQAQELTIKVVRHLSILDSVLASNLAVQWFLPRYRNALVTGRGGTSKREAILRMLYAHASRLQVTDKLAIFRNLQESLTVDPSLHAYGHARHSCAQPGDLTAFLTALSFISALEDNMDEPLADFYVYYAIVGLSMPSGKCRAAALAILTNVASHGFVLPVTKLSDRLISLAKQVENETWEVAAQLTILCGALLDALLPALPTPRGTPKGTPPASGTPPLSRESSRPRLQDIIHVDAKGIHGLTPAHMAASARTVYQLIISLLGGCIPMPAKKVALTALAPRVTGHPHEYLIHDSQLHADFLSQYVTLLLSLPASARRLMLDRDQPDQLLPGTVRIYVVTPISTVWDPLTAAMVLSDVMEARRGSHAVVPVEELHDIVEVFALGILGPHFASDQNCNKWWGLLKRVEKDFYAAFQDISTKSTQGLYELLVHVVTQFYLELVSPDLDPDITLETVQTNAIEWFHARN